jgi:hypothetical protein
VFQCLLKSRLPIAQVLAARVFHHHRRAPEHALAAVVFHLYRRPTEHTFAARVVHLDCSATAQAFAAGVFYFYRHENAPEVFHLNLQVFGQTLAPYPG